MKHKGEFTTDVPKPTAVWRLVIGLFGYYAVTLILKSIVSNSIEGLVATIITTFIQTFYVTFVFPWCIKKWKVLL